MASSATWYRNIEGKVTKISVVWTSDASAGTVTEASPWPVHGLLMRVTTIPGTSGNQPDDNYDFTITDENSVDIAIGTLANRDESNTETVYPSTTSSGTKTDFPTAVSDIITLNGSNIGNSNKGTIVMYFV
jgi:hypothetical protein